jgi:putative membrane protein
MTAEILLRYAHFISIFLLVAALTGEALLIRPGQLPRRTVQQLFRLDGLYGLSSVLIVGVGLTLWFGVGKPADFYSFNWIFYLKLGLFTGMAILSIWPSVYFFKNRKGDDPEELVAVPDHLPLLIRLELLLLALIPLCAAFMAKGVGYFGD